MKRQRTDAEAKGAGAEGAEAKAKVDLFEKLPNCLQQAFCQFLDLNSRSQIVQTCKKGEIALSALAWPPNLHLEFDTKQPKKRQFTAWFFKNVHPLPKCRSLHLRQPTNFSAEFDNHFAKLFTPNLKSLRVDEKQRCLVPETLLKTSLEHLEGPLDIFAPLLGQYPNLASARLCGDSSTKNFILESPSLTELELSFGNTLPKGISMPRLSTLTIDIQRISVERNILGGLLNMTNAPCLVHLHLVDGEIDFGPSFVLDVHNRLKRFEFLAEAKSVEELMGDTICSLVQNSREYLQSSQLEQLEMHVSGLETFRGWEFFFDCLNHMPRLRRVVLRLEVDNNAEEVLDPKHLIPILQHVAKRDNAPVWWIVSDCSSIPKTCTCRVLQLFTEWV